MKEWLENATHEALVTPEAQGALGKYETMEDAVAGGLEAQKMVGKPFKLPESMDKLADDDSRAEFRTGALKVLGSVDNVDALNDFNFYAGKPDGYEPTDADKVIASTFAQHIVDNNIPVGIAGKMVEFYNSLMAKAQQDIENKYLAQTETANKQMLEMLKGEDNVKLHAENIKTLFRNHGGLTAEEYESVAGALVDNKYTTSIVLQKALGNIATKLVTEGTTVSGVGTGTATEHEQTPYEWKKARWPQDSTMWGKEDDTWATQSVELRKRAKIKDK